MAALFSKLGISVPDILDFRVTRRAAPLVSDEISDNADKVSDAFSFELFDLGSGG
jgi:hypothetical protein